MGQKFEYLYESQWITEGSIWRPPDQIILHDEAGAVIPSTQMATMTMTIYDGTGGLQAIVNGVDGTTDVKNTRSCTLSTGGVFVLTLLPTDTAILVSTHAYEIRHVLVEYTWPSTPTKSDALQITCVIRNVTRRPYVAPPP